MIRNVLTKSGGGYRTYLSRFDVYSRLHGDNATTSLLISPSQTLNTPTGDNATVGHCKSGKTSLSILSYRSVAAVLVNFCLIRLSALSATFSNSL